MPSIWWFTVHVSHTAVILWRHVKSLGQMEPGLHHLTPVVGVINAFTSRFSMGPVAERELLSWFWTLLEV